MSLMSISLILTHLLLWLCIYAIFLQQKLIEKVIKDMDMMFDVSMVIVTKAIEEDFERFRNEGNV